MNVVPFSELLKYVNRLITVEDIEEYACGGVRLNGRGVFIREYKNGSQILKKNVQHIVRENDVVFSTLFAGKGAFAVADNSVDGAISRAHSSTRARSFEIPLGQMRSTRTR